MDLIEYNVFERKGSNASSKAKRDVSEILRKEGFRKLYSPSKFRIFRIFQQFLSILQLSKDSLIIVQYHSNISFFYRMLYYRKSIKKVAIIHDLESLRGLISVKKEICLLNGFDFIISHNPYMTKYLNDNGVQQKIVNLQIFDYLLSFNIEIKDCFTKDTVFFAGNLVKSHFLKYLSDINDITFYIYGAEYIGIEELKSQANVKYKGSFNPEQLIANIEGGWGLVWDGDSLDTCSGINGEYLKYNNPHKVSMCIVSERPVIIWSRAAMADFIVNHGLGIAVDSLKDLKTILSEILPNEYLEMKENVKKEKKRLINGCSLNDVIKRIKICVQ